METHTRDEPKIVAAAERKMHDWAMQMELRDRAMRGEAEARSTQRVLKFVINVERCGKARAVEQILAAAEG